jgi:hypothetical protein
VKFAGVVRVDQHTLVTKLTSKPNLGGERRIADVNTSLDTDCFDLERPCLISCARSAEFFVHERVACCIGNRDVVAPARLVSELDDAVCDTF